MQRLFMTAVLVHDYDEAIAFYTGRLGFELRLDTPLSPRKRWVVVAPPGGGQGCILLAKAETAEQSARVGDQTAGPRYERLVASPQDSLGITDSAYKNQ